MNIRTIIQNTFECEHMDIEDRVVDIALEILN